MSYNLNDHEQRNSMPAIAVTIEVVTTVFLWVRIANRMSTNSRLGLDDALIVVAWILGVGVTITTLLGTEKYNFNRHIWDVPQEDWWKGALVAFLVETFFFWSTCLTKISVLMFYRRLVVGTYSRNFKFAIWAAIGFVAAYTISFFVTIVVSCSPVEAQWKQYDYIWASKHKFTCAPRSTVTAVAKLVGSLSVITDFYSVMLPAFLLLQIRISKRQKYGLLFIFGIGFLVVGAGVARTYYLGAVFSEVYDKSWLTWNVLVASIIECNLAILCACAPSLKALFGKFFEGVSTRFGSKDTKPDSYSKVSDGSSTLTTFNMKEPAQTMRKPSAVSRLYDAELAQTEKGGSSFKQAHEFGRDYRETIAVGYGEKLMLPPVRSFTPLTTTVLDDAIALPVQNGNRVSDQHVGSTESYIISPSPSISSDDEISLVDKAAEAHDVWLPYGLPERSETLVRSSSQRSQNYGRPDLSQGITRSSSQKSQRALQPLDVPVYSPLPRRPSTGHDQFPSADSSFSRGRQHDMLFHADIEYPPKSHRQSSRDRWERYTRYPAV